MSLEDVRQKIRSLRELERRATTQGEAEAAARAAAALLEKYRLSEAEVEAAGAEPNEACVVDEEPFYSYRRAERWKLDLIHVLVGHYGVVWYRERTMHGRRARGSRNRASYKICLVGRPSDVFIVRHFYAWLTAEAVRLVPEWHPARPTPRARLTRSWLLGFVRGIQDQLKSAHAEVHATGSKTALVKLNERLDDAKRYLRAFDPNMETIGDRVRKVHMEAYQKGRERGLEQHLGEALPSCQKALPRGSEES